MKIESKPPRCKFVLAIINSKLEILELIREDIYPIVSETGESGPFEFAVVKVKITINI